MVKPKQTKLVFKSFHHGGGSQNYAVDLLINGRRIIRLVHVGIDRWPNPDTPR
jgi:hypothetical protein